MTGLEIGLAVGFGLFIVFAILVGIGAAVEQGNFLKRAKVAARIAKSAEEDAQYYQRKLVKTQESWEALVQRVERAKSRILNAESHECRLRFERKGEPSCYYGAQHGHIARGLAEALTILEQETWPRHDTRQQAAEARVGAPAHGPVAAPCVVCGGHTCTYRWGQWVSRWDSMSNIRGTFATTRWQEFDPDLEVGWFPVCARHANDLDGGDNIVVRRVGYHRG